MRWTNHIKYGYGFEHSVYRHGFKVNRCYCANYSTGPPCLRAFQVEQFNYI